MTNTSGCGSGGAWESFASTKTGWSLGQTNGAATVYVQFEDDAGNISSCVSDSITHDATAPTAPGSFDDATNTSSATNSPTMSWAASNDAGSGVADYQIAIGTTAGDTDIQDWTSVGNVTSANVNSLSLTLGNTYYGSVRALDAAGNPSSVSMGNGFTYTIQWKQQAYIKASNGSSNDSLGENIALDNDTLAATSDCEDSSQTTITNGTSASTDNSASESGAAYVFRRSATTWAQEAYIKAANNEAADGPRMTVALHGNTLAIGKVREDSNQTTIINGTTASNDNSATESGAVYVYSRSAANWTQEAYIKAANSGADDYFGFRLSLYGNTLAVSADEEDSNVTTIVNGTTASADNTNTNSGAVYVYVRSGTTWAQEAFIKAANSGLNDSFGEGVGLWADTLAVGAQTEDSSQTTITNGTTASADNSLTTSGAVYVYKRSAGSWAQEAYLKAANAGSGDYFGGYVALNGDTLAVSALWEDSEQTTITNGTTASSTNGSSNAGAVYIFTRTGTTWAQQAYIKAANVTAEDNFGHSIALSTDTLIVGVENEDSNQTTITNGTAASADDSASAAGAAYVYQRTATAWAQQAYIKAANAQGSDWFGYRVGISGDTIAISADGEDSNVTTITNGTGVSTDNSSADSGAIYIYTR